MEDYCNNKNLSITEFNEYCLDNGVCKELCKTTFFALFSLVLLIYLIICCEVCFLKNFFKEDEDIEENIELIIEGKSMKIQPPKYEDI